MPSVQTAAGILRDLSRRCAQAATGAPAPRNGSSASHNGSPAPHNGAPASFPGAAQQPAYSGPTAGQRAVTGAAQGLTPPAGNGALSAPAPASVPAPTSTPAEVPSQGMAPAVPAAPSTPHASPALTPPAARPESVGSPAQVGGQERCAHVASFLWAARAAAKAAWPSAGPKPWLRNGCIWRPVGPRTRKWRAVWRGIRICAALAGNVLRNL